MGSRTYDFELSCGCMLSQDAGGGLIPCNLGFGYDEEGNERELTPEEQEHDKLHNEAWEKYRASDLYKQHQNEIEKRNR